jgi:UPF0271 protein
MKLNADLGETFGGLSDSDRQLMPLLDQANIACGGHAGDLTTMQETVAFAKQHNVSIGAHPSYPDLANFGRVTVDMPAQELQQAIVDQVKTLQQACLSEGIQLSYVKPHGALYNDMMRDLGVMNTVIRAIVVLNSDLKLMIQATPDFENHRAFANQHGIELILEAFADRGYQANGLLMPRSIEGAVLTADDAVKQVHELKCNGCISTMNGSQLRMPVDTVCVHGDNPEALKVVQQIRALI